MTYNIQTPDNSGGIKTAQPAHTCQVYCIHDTPFNYIGLVNSRKICGIISRNWSIFDKIQILYLHFIKYRPFSTDPNVRLCVMCFANELDLLDDQDVIK